MSVLVIGSSNRGSIAEKLSVVIGRSGSHLPDFLIGQKVGCMDKPWYQSLVGILWGTAKFVLAPFMAGTPILAIYGALHASDIDLNALQLRSTQIPILVGTAGDDKDCSKYTPCSSAGQRMYLVLPEALLKGEIAVVNHRDAIVNVDRHPFYGYIEIAMWAACVALTWRYCIRPWLPASKRIELPGS